MLLLFGLPLLAPVLASDIGEAGLPACCRRSGKHHCAMAGTMLRQQGHAISMIAEKCPYTPAVARLLPWTPLAPSIEAAIFAGVIRHPAVHAQAEALYRVSFDRTRQKRGPPV